MVVSSYYDDFTQLQAEEMGESATATLRETSARLGVVLSVDTKKDKPFAYLCEPLGVVLNLDGVGARRGGDRTKTIAS